MQGSYRNTTNIRGDSDVDLVVELTSVYYCNLSDAEKARLGWQAANYSWAAFRADVISALVAYFGPGCVDTWGSKSIKVLPDRGRLKCDVVVTANYKYYENLAVRAEGMIFWTQPVWQEIVNYPKVHYNSGANKNSDARTRGRYKRTVRTYKNARQHLVEDNSRLQGRFPSYFVEGRLYNVPDGQYGGTWQANFTDTINWLNSALKNAEADKFVCPNGMNYLFGPKSVQWNRNDAQELVTQLIGLWNNW